MPNTFAYFALFASPVFFFLAFRALSLQAAVGATIIGGYLLLPERPTIDLPLLPAIDKSLIPALSVLVIAVFTHSRLKTRAVKAERLGQPIPPVPVVMPGLWPRSKVITALLVMLVLGAVGTALTNSDQVLAGGNVVLPGLRIFDVFSLTLSAFTFLLPMFLGRKYLADPEGHRILLITLTIAGLLYCFPALVEVRLSPQMSVWVYGFFPHSFIQHMRDGGFRPVVFLNHGLWLSMIFAMSFLGALAVARLQDSKDRILWYSFAFVLFVTLFLSKSLGALLITMIVAPVILAAPKRTIVIFAVSVCGVILLYPLVRSSGLVPVDAILDFAYRIDVTRGRSLAFRLLNEDELLASALERSIFGWGGWGRGYIYDQNSGGVLSVSDGAWIIQLLVGGWIRYLSIFGILALPIILLWFTRKGAELALPTVLLQLVLLANLIDLLPNATLTPVTWLLAGALVGSLEYRPSVAPDEEPSVQPQVTGDAAVAARARYSSVSGPRKVRRRVKAQQQQGGRRRTRNN